MADLRLADWSGMEMDLFSAMPMASGPHIIYANDEIIVAASERSAIRTVFNVGENEVLELMPGNGADCKIRWPVYGRTDHSEPKERRACSFERIYFSRGSDEKIYRERIALGYNLSEQILNAVNHDLKNTHLFLYSQYGRSGFLWNVERHG